MPLFLFIEVCKHGALYDVGEKYNFNRTEIMYSLQFVGKTKSDGYESVLVTLLEFRVSSSHVIMNVFSFQLQF